MVWGGVCGVDCWGGDAGGVGERLGGGFGELGSGRGDW